ncbi:MAG: SDR family NAD(P)-dependent oxidoreductase [Acidimicrobiales bacterium]
MPNALITGGSAGLGRALAVELTRRGWGLVLDGRDRDRLDAVSRELSSRTAIRTVSGSVADPGHRRSLFEAAQEVGGIDLLVNNASTLGPSPMPDLGTLAGADIEAIYAVNVFAPLALCQAFADSLEARGGAIINITSDAGVGAYPGWGGYGSSKAALELLSAVLAAERPGLRVYWVDPGDMRTQMHQDAFPGEDISDRPLPEVAVPGFIDLIEGRAPSGRYLAQRAGADEGGSR